MSFERINLFSRTVDPDGVLGLMQKLGKKVLIEWKGYTWSKATIVGERAGWFGKAPQLIIGHSPDHYVGKQWEAQREGLARYFSLFPKGENQENALVVIRGVEFALAVRSDDFEIDDPNDVRRPWLEAICQHLDGVLYTPASLRYTKERILLALEQQLIDGVFLTPSSLRDAKGRILVAANGKFDSRAQFPKELVSPPLEEGLRQVAT